jgi:HAD superfamily hydrolase (TIGR01459 family)
MIGQEYFPRLHPVATRYAGVLLDAYGVFWQGNELGLIEGSIEAMKSLMQNGKIVGILTNTTQLANKEITKLERYGLIKGEHFHFLITSGEVTRNLLLNKKLPFETPNNTYWLFGEIHEKFSSHEPIFEGTDYRQTDNVDEADFILISIPHIGGKDQTDPEVFREKIAEISSKKLPMLCMNPDQFAQEGNPPKLVVRQGTIGKMYEEMGGKVYYMGKPNNTAYAIALDHFKEYQIEQPHHIVMVGDTPETDIQGARHSKMHSALVTETGIMANRISQKGKNEAFEELEEKDTPNFVIGRL